MNPNTVVTLYATDFDISNRHIVYVTSEAEALGAVSTFPKKVYPDCYWQRDASAFRATGNINEVKKYNYCTFENNGKLNFAFITNFTYINDDMTMCHIEIDPWLNYGGTAGYIIGASPIDRQHIVADSGFNSNGDFPEPIDLMTEWPEMSDTQGDPGTDDATNFIITGVDLLNFLNKAQTLYDGLGSLIKDGDGSSLGAMFSALSANQCNCEVCIQAPTSTSGGMAGSALASFAAVGRSDLIYGGYHIPKAFRTYKGTSTSIGSMPVKDIDELKVDPSIWKSAAHWKKIWQSPQYNKIRVNVCGIIRDYPISEFADTKRMDGKITFKGKATQDAAGCITIFSEDYKQGAGQSIVQSPSWDRVQVNGVGVRRNSEFEAGVQMTKAATAIGSTLYSAINPLTNIDLSGLDVAENALNSAINTMRGTPYSVGQNAVSISSYNLLAPLVEVAWIGGGVGDMNRLNNFFSTFGYARGGQTEEVHLNDMPIWNYVKTVSANIIGKAVPQKDVIKIINMFNRGVFIYNGISNYKQLNKVSQNIP